MVSKRRFETDIYLYLPLLVTIILAFYNGFIISSTIKNYHYKVYKDKGECLHWAKTLVIACHYYYTTNNNFTSKTIFFNGIKIYLVFSPWVSSRTVSTALVSLNMFTIMLLFRSVPRPTSITVLLTMILPTTTMMKVEIHQVQELRSQGTGAPALIVLVTETRTMILILVIMVRVRRVSTKTSHKLETEAW